MHAPDGFLNAGTAVATGALSAGTIGLALRQATEGFREKQVPLAGLAAAFVFAAQMFNFPVVAGTTGHLLGGALAAVLLGPRLGAIVVAIVVVVQALVFADGGLTALGYNTLNMAIVPAFGGYALFVGFRKLLPATSAGVVASTALAGGLSVVLSAAAFSLEWLFGATAPVPFDTVFGAMVGIHLLIGLGEGIISGMTIGAVLASRPDLVYGASDIEHRSLHNSQKIPVRSFIIAGVLMALLVAVVASQFAASGPDGLESVAAQTGIGADLPKNSFVETVFADYATSGIGDERVSLAVAGATGVVITLAVGYGLLAAAKGSPKRRPRKGRKWE